MTPLLVELEEELAVFVLDDEVVLVLVVVGMLEVATEIVVPMILVLY